jgi:tetratricopeptide (TPR) repeat protein
VGYTKVLFAGAAVFAAVSWVSASNPRAIDSINPPSVPAAQRQSQGTVGRASDPGQVRTLLDAGRLVDAEAAANAELAAAEKTHGPDAPATADALELLLEARRALRRTSAPGTVALAERLVRLREATRGPDDESTATALVTLGRIKSTNRDYDGARTAVERALSIRERLFGPEHLAVANALNALATVNRQGRQDAQAGAFGGRALAMARRLEVPAGIETATALVTLAILDRLNVEPERIVRMVEEAIAIEGRLRPADHPLNASTFLQLAQAYREVGDLHAARTAEARGIAMLESSGTNNYQIAFEMIELAAINDAIGDYTDALSVAERAVALSERVTSPTSTLTASALGILATMHSRLGDHVTAASTRERVVKLWSASSPDSLHVASALTALAESYWALGRMDEAFDCVERALAMKPLQNEPMMLSRTLQGSARLFVARGRTADARSALERAIAAGKAANQSLTRISIGMALSDLATLERRDGHPDRALVYAREALQLLEKELGVDNVRTAARRSVLSAILAETGAFDEARKQLVEGERASLDHLRMIARTLPDRRALDFAAERQSGRNLAVTLATHPKIAAPGDIDMAWRIVVQGRNVVVDEMAARQQTVIAEAQNASVRDQWVALNHARARLANLVIGGPQGLTPEAYQALVERTRAAHDRAERDLAEASAAFRQEQSRTRADVHDVLAALPKQTALISYVRYVPERLPGSPRPASAKTGANAELEDYEIPGAPAAYAAFVGRTDGLPPRVVALGSADAIDAAVARWRAGIQSELTSGGLAARRSETAYREAGAALRRLIWDPVQPFVRSTSSAFIVPDGAINLVDFSTLPIDRVTPAAGASGARAGSAPRAAYLVDEPIALHYILAERDLVQPPPEPRGHSLLALGAPDFDKVDRAAVAALASEPMTVGRASIAGTRGTRGAGGGGAGDSGSGMRVPRGSAGSEVSEGSEVSAESEVSTPRAACEALSTRTFDPLPGTRQEMQQIAALWRQGTSALRPAAGPSPSSSPSTGSSPSPSGNAASNGAADTSGDDSVMLLGDDRASETAFKVLASGRRVLHLATHGFFLDRACGTSPATTNVAANGANGGANTSARGGAAPAGTPLLAESPLLRSGLVLAGANRRAETDRDEDDGILTAEEIAGLDLSAAQWAVLSACDTGRGDLQAGEGVVGLRRAFQVAGARTVILSLWPVLDNVAADWMAELYRGKFVRGDTTATSIRAASRSLLAARRAAGQSTHPLYWSGFIATGDWR